MCLGVLAFLASLCVVQALPDGAPLAACATMFPQHLVDAQTDVPPYNISQVQNEDGTYNGIS